MKIENIKFKAKRLDGKGWVEGNLRTSKSGNAMIIPIENSGAYPVEPATVCQFTGLKDCKGKEIWEGDILHNTNSINRYTIMYSDFGAFFMRKNGTKDLGMYLFELAEKDKCLTFFKVVGNKFDKEGGKA